MDIHSSIHGLNRKGIPSIHMHVIVRSDTRGGPRGTVRLNNKEKVKASCLASDLESTMSDLMREAFLNYLPVLEKRRKMLQEGTPIDPRVRDPDKRKDSLNS